MTDFALVLFAITNVLKHMFSAVKEKLILKRQGSRAQLKLTLISIMVVKGVVDCDFTFLTLVSV